MSFRRPDAPLIRIPQRLPGKAPGLPELQIEWLTVDDKTEPSVRIRLTRYNGAALQPKVATVTRPVLLIYGYSASGTTFAHPAVPGTSRKPCARRAATFGSSICVAAPVYPRQPATGHSRRWRTKTFRLPSSMFQPRTRRPMPHLQELTSSPTAWEAAMFSMAMLADGPRQERLHQKVGRVGVLAGWGLVDDVEPDQRAGRLHHALRASLRLHARVYVQPARRKHARRSAVHRALAAMSMPRGEFRRENPFFPPRATPWAGTRHRMDALYGRTFSLKNLSKGVLDHLDDSSARSVSKPYHR